MVLKSKNIVVDTGAFVKNVPLWEYAEELVTVDDIRHEIKDKQTQQYIAAYPVLINFRQPRPESVKFINEFTRKTGDYHVLSLVDTLLLALTYELEVDAKGSNHLRTEPRKKIVNTQVSVPVAQGTDDAHYTQDNDVNDHNKTNNGNSDSKKEINEAQAKLNALNLEADCNSKDKTNDSECEEEEHEDGDGWNKIRRKKQHINEGNDDTVSVTSTVRRRQKEGWEKQKLVGFYAPREEDEEQNLDDSVCPDDCSIDGENGASNDEECEGEYSSDTDEEGWITPANIGNISKGLPLNSKSFFDEEQAKEEKEEEQPTVVCITGDFAMQNVLHHIGLKVMGVNGKLIKDARTYVLRCFACFLVTPDMSKLFCPRCGNRTLKRVSITLNPDGSQQIWISRRRLNTRGMRHNLPKPRGGQHAIMPLLTADQRFPQQWAKRNKNVAIGNQDYLAGANPFGAHDLYSRAAQHGYHVGEQRGINGQLKHAKIWKPKRGKPTKKK